MKDYSHIEKEYSKVWCGRCHDLFTTGFLEFLEEHPSKEWHHSFEQTEGFFKIIAEKKHDPK